MKCRLSNLPAKAIPAGSHPERKSPLRSSLFGCPEPRRRYISNSGQFTNGQMREITVPGNVFSGFSETVRRVGLGGIFCGMYLNVTHVTCAKIEYLNFIFFCCIVFERATGNGKIIIYCYFRNTRSSPVEEVARIDLSAGCIPFTQVQCAVVRKLGPNYRFAERRSDRPGCKSRSCFRVTQVWLKYFTIVRIRSLA